MKLQLTREIVPEVHWVDAVGSTNDLLKELSTSAGVEGGRRLPHGTLVVTTDQTAGRGRAGRQWETPPDTAVACSFLLDVPRGAGALSPSWLPLLAGSAVAKALQGYFPAGMRVGVKWPNDVHVRSEEDAIAGGPGQKLCGILCELTSAETVIIGIGMNLLIPEHEMPTDRATSVLAAGGNVDGVITLATPEGEALADRVIAAVARELLALIDLAEAEPHVARTRVLRHSLTLGTEVRVHLPSGEAVDGRARALAEDGSLVVDLPTGGDLTVSAGDVEHLR